MDVQSISTAILDSMSGLSIHLYDYSTDSPHPPAAYIYPRTIPFHNAFGDVGDAQVTWIVRLLAASIAQRGGQRVLNTLVSTGTGSAVAAIETDQTLGGVVNGCYVAQVENYGVLQLPDGARFYTADLVLHILPIPDAAPVLTTEAGAPLEVV